MPMILDDVHSLELITSVKFTYVEHEFYIFPHQIFLKESRLGSLQYIVVPCKLIV